MMKGLLGTVLALLFGLAAATATASETRLVEAIQHQDVGRVRNAEVMKLLLLHGGDANAKEPSQDQTALMWAISERHADVARMLVEGGADARARTKPLPRQATTMYQGGEGNRAYAAAGLLS